MKKKIKQQTKRLKKEEIKKPIKFNWKPIIILGLIILIILLALFLKNAITGKAIGEINPANTEDPLGIGLNPDDLQEKLDNPQQTKNETISYIKKEWSKIFRNESRFPGKYMGPILRGYDKISPYTNPIMKYTIGIEPGMNWLFVLCLVMWITFLTNFNTILSTFSTFSKTASFIIALSMAVVYGATGVNKIFGEKIISLISLTNKWWVQLILILIIISIFILLSMFRGEWNKLDKKLREKNEKERLEEDVEILKTKQKSQDEINKTLGDAFE